MKTIPTHKLLYKIGEVSNMVGVSIRTIRFYEEKGIITPVRKNKHRLYSKRDIVRLKLAIKGRNLHFSIDEISAIINTYDRSRSVESNQQQALKMIQVCDKHITILDKKIENIVDLKTELFRVKEQMLQFLMDIHKHTSHKHTSHQEDNRQDQQAVSQTPQQSTNRNTNQTLAQLP